MSIYDSLCLKKSVHVCAILSVYHFTDKSLIMIIGRYSTTKHNALVFFLYGSCHKLYIGR